MAGTEGCYVCNTGTLLTLSSGKQVCTNDNCDFDDDRFNECYFCDVEFYDHYSRGYCKVCELYLYDEFGIYGDSTT